MDAHDARKDWPDPPPDVATAEDLLTRARRGDLVAFRELMRQHQSRVYSVALRFTGQRGDAEELLQDVFLQLHGALAKLENEAHLKRWLLRTVSHRCIDRLRHAGRRPKLVSIGNLPDTHEPKAPDNDIDHLAASRIRELMLELAPDARAVMLLRFQEDLDPAEIADVLAMPVATVKSHLRRSLEWLRTRMEGNGHGS
jgi:RNA polymerase sigma-70 factor (ECF subfamily)